MSAGLFVHFHLELKAEQRITLYCPVPPCDQSWAIAPTEPIRRVKDCLYSHLRARHSLDGRRRNELASRVLLPLRVAGYEGVA